MAVTQWLDDGILLVTIFNPPVNALSAVERQGLIDAVAAADAPDVAAVVICGEGRSFIAGADVREFGKPPLAPHLPDVVAAIEACPKPVVGAIAGAALGGGLEIALGCHYRIAAAGAKLGLPEVTLGIVPGAGGTQRLPRLIDPVRAATMISGGKPIGAAEALALGLVDEVVAPADLLAAARALARRAASEDIGARRLSTRPAPDAQRHRALLDTLAAEVKRSARGAQAPAAALALAEAALTLPFAEGMMTERETFLRLRSSDEAAALRHIFFAERAAARPPEDIVDATPHPTDTVGVIGAGTMGTGIAMSLADAGLAVRIVEVSQDGLDRGLARIADAYRASAARGRLSAETAEARIAAVGGSTDYATLADCDLIIEAAFEALDVKQAIFAQLDAVAKPSAVLATNTSYLDIEAIADVVSRPEAVIGLHYFSPANVMKLLEIVRPARAAPEALVTALALARRTGKTPVVAGVCNGFIGNRMLRAYTREAGLLLIEGATPDQIDRALTRFGMAMGPFAVADMSGIDVAYKARQQMPAGVFEPEAVLIHNGLVEAGDLGRKTGRGFYLHEGDSAGRTVNPRVATLVDKARAATRVTPREIGDDEIVERCMLAMAIEGGAIVDEGIAARSGGVDVVYVNGYGFPRHRGGPMFYAGALGGDHVRARAAELAAGRWGKWWALPRYWSEAAG